MNPSLTDRLAIMSNFELQKQLLIEKEVQRLILEYPSKSFEEQSEIRERIRKVVSQTTVSRLVELCHFNRLKKKEESMKILLCSLQEVLEDCASRMGIAFEYLDEDSKEFGIAASIPLWLESLEEKKVALLSSCLSCKQLHELIIFWVRLETEYDLCKRTFAVIVAVKEGEKYAEAFREALLKGHVCLEEHVLIYSPRNLDLSVSALNLETVADVKRSLQKAPEFFIKTIGTELWDSVRSKIKVRLFFFYSGHGTPPSAGPDGGVILPNQSVLRKQSLRLLLQKYAEVVDEIVSFIDACYGEENGGGYLDLNTNGLSHGSNTSYVMLSSSTFDKKAYNFLFPKYLLRALNGIKCDGYCPTCSQFENAVAKGGCIRAIELFEYIKGHSFMDLFDSLNIAPAPVFLCRSTDFTSIMSVKSLKTVGQKKYTDP